MKYQHNFVTKYNPLVYYSIYSTWIESFQNNHIDQQPWIIEIDQHLFQLSKGIS